MVKKIWFGVVLILLCLIVADAKAGIVIDTSDIPLSSKCWTNHGIDDALDSDTWSPAKWGNIPITNWSPLISGVQYLPNSSGVKVRFVFSKENIQFFKQAVFPSTNTRIPFALEIDVLDYLGIYGTVSADDFYIASDNLPKTPAKMLIADVAYMDPIHQLSALISRPDLLEPYKIYEIVLKANNPNIGMSGDIRLNLQLSVNYKWLAAMRNGVSTSCDIVTLMENVKFSLSTTNLVTQNYGADIPAEAVHGWYYFVAAQTDSTLRLKVAPDPYVTSSKDYICSDDIENPANNDSGFRYCRKLFDLTAGSGYGNFIKFVGSPKIYYLSGVDNQLWWLTDEVTFYALGGDFNKVIEYETDKYKVTDPKTGEEKTYFPYIETTTQYPISGSATLVSGALSRSITSTINLKSNDWTYDVGHTFQYSVSAGDIKIIDYAGTEFSVEQAVTKGLIYKTIYLYDNDYYPQDAVNMVLNPWDCYVIYAFVPGLRIVLSSSMDKDKAQSIIDMNTVAVADSRFIPYGFHDSFGVNPNWTTSYSLNQMAYPLATGGYTWVSQAVNKTNKFLRYVCFLDPATGQWTAWKMVM